MPDYTVQFAKNASPDAADRRLDAAAFHRNHEAIWAVLAPHLRDAAGDAVEVGSGTGQHVVEFAGRTPRLTWWPSDLNDRHLKSIEAWRAYSGLANVRPPLRIDLTDPLWCSEMAGGSGPGPLQAVFAANVVHIAPWTVAEGLIGGAARYLGPKGRLFLYGPFKRDGKHTAASNAAFDASLRDGNPEWGLRDIAEIAAVAAGVGLTLAEVVDMPSNNFLLVFARNNEGAA